MILWLRIVWSQINPRSPVILDSVANPALYDFVWVPWLEDDEKTKESLKTQPIFPLAVSTEELQYVFDLNLSKFSEQINSYMKQMTNSFVENVSRIFSF